MRRCFFLVLLLLLGVSGAVQAQETHIVISFMGDCTLGSEERTRGLPTSFDSYIQREGYAYPFAQVQDILAQDDVSVINMEGVLYDRTDHRVKKTYNFRGPTHFAHILREGSIELSFLGNNHAFDYGLPGFESTGRALTGAGLDWFALTEHSDKTYIFEKNGIKVGFTGAYMSHWWQSRPQMRASFEALKAAGCDFIVAVMHGGGEYYPRQGLNQERMAQALIKLGAGVVVGHHPHLLQGAEIHQQANILYSLGNFSFGGNAGLKVMQTAIAQMTLRFDAQGRYLGQQLNLIPAHVSGTSKHNNYQPVLVQGDEAQAVLRTLQRVSTYPLSPYLEGVGAVQAFLPALPPPLLSRQAQ